MLSCGEGRRNDDDGLVGESRPSLWRRLRRRPPPEVAPRRRNRRSAMAVPGGDRTIGGGDVSARWRWK